MNVVILDLERSMILVARLCRSYIMFGHVIIVDEQKHQLSSGRLDAHWNFLQ